MKYYILNIVALIAIRAAEQAEEDQDGHVNNNPLFPMGAREMIGTATFALFMALSTVAGIGGGGVAIPMVMGFF